MKFIKFIIFCIGIFSFYGCADFLDEKPDKKIVVPKDLHDLRALLDATGRLNNSVYNGLLEIGTDDYWLDKNSFAGLNDFDKANYTWQHEVLYQATDVQAHWTNGYAAIMMANTVLDELDILNIRGQEADELMGEALFFRAFGFYHLALVYSPTYTSGNMHKYLGIPLRLSSDPNEPTTRSTVFETYQRILKDAESSIKLLSNTSQYKTRPNKCAAHALLARIYISIGEYELALDHALKALVLHDVLIDYNTINGSVAIPFSRFNDETIFYAHAFGANLLHPNRCNISERLLGLYDQHDLRKQIFFQERSPGIYSFKGGYHGLIANTYFIGLATDELYLIAAECYARTGQRDEALVKLNKLLVNRIESTHFSDFHADNDIDLLKKILEERRKQLVFRGVRWSDLKRLNQDDRFKVYLHRDRAATLDIPNFDLPPNDNRYVFLIPNVVIDMTSMPQNPR